MVNLLAMLKEFFFKAPLYTSKAKFLPKTTNQCIIAVEGTNHRNPESETLLE